MSDTKKTIKWNSLLDAIEEGKCVLCIGPEIYTNEQNQMLEEQVINFLKKHDVLDEDIITYPDGLFFFKDPGKRSDVLSALKNFYQEDFANTDAIFQKLIKIPFNLSLFLTPDTRYHDLAQQERFNMTRDYYVKMQPPKVKSAPTKNAPMVYHLFGSLNNHESVILTYDDLYDFFNSVFVGQSMSESMHKTIENARHFVCLGIPFEKWYMQLLLRVLKLRNESLTKYAANHHYKHDSFATFQDQFNITFVPEKTKEFVEGLYQRCEEKGLLRRRVEKNNSIKDRINNFIAENMLEEAADEMLKHLQAHGTDVTDIDDELVQLKRRLRSAAADRRLGALTYEEYNKEAVQVVKGLQECVKKIMELQN